LRWLLKRRPERAGFGAVWVSVSAFCSRYIDNSAVCRKKEQKNERMPAGGAARNEACATAALRRDAKSCANR